MLTKFGKNSPNESERDMLIKLAFQYVESQNKVELNYYKYVVEKNFAHFGDLDECISDLTKTSNNRETPNSSKIDMAKEALNSIESNKNSLPDSILSQIANLNMESNEKVSTAGKDAESKKPLIQEVNSEPVKIPVYEENFSSETHGDFCDLKIYLPKISSFKECELDIDNNCELTLKANELFYKKLTISLDKYRETHEIMLDCIEAKFVKKSSLLKIKIPLVKLKK